MAVYMPPDPHLIQNETKSMSTSLKLTKSVSSELNTMNKRPAPSQARLEKLQQLKKRKKNEVTSVSLQDDGHEVLPKQNLIRATAPSLVAIDTEVSMWKRRNGESIPKLHTKGDSRKKKVLFTLPTLVVKWQNLGKEGNLNRKMGNHTVTDINKAKITVSLEKGCPEQLKTLFPNLLGEQEAFFNALNEKCREHMEVAFVQEDDRSWDAIKKGKEMDEFVNGANFSCIKKIQDEHDDSYEIINMARRVLDFQGNPNECAFWKSNDKGEYEQIEPKYIRKGSLLRCMGSLRSYKVSAEMYGVSMDLERDIVVVWMPPEEQQKPQEKTVDPVAPFLNFNY